MNIAVTGIGIICAIGNDAKAVVKSLKEKQTGIGTMRYLDSSHKELPVGEVKLSNEEMTQMLGLDSETAIRSRTVLMGAIAIRQALEDAKLDPKGKRVVVINGTTVGGMDVTERYFLQMREQDDLLPLIEKHDCGSSTREMADLAGLLEAEVCTISTACSSAANAIILGSEMLKMGEADIVIAGGTESLSKFHLNGFNTLMILDKEQCRPFDKTRTGLNLGEGAAFVVLKTPSNSPLKGEKQGQGARSREQEDTINPNNSLAPCPSPLAPRPIYILGYGNRCDAFHQTASSENGEGAFLAMSDALQMAGLKPQDIQYINAHGTGTPNNDASESAAIRRVFGDEIPPVSSTKGFTGHTTSAAGAIETVISILALQHGFVPANLGWKTQDSDCITPSMGSGKYPISNVLCNSFGFGGNDSALIISKDPGPFLTSHERGNLKLQVVGEATIEDIDQLQEIREYLSPGEARRMGKLLKAATVTSLKALRQAGEERPDAIITATAFGMLETSEKFLREMLENGEETLSPTLFMQSTHNTIGSSIAIRTKCHGYNVTYTQGKDSLQWALRDARRLIETGRATTVLVGCHDEATPTLQDLFRRMGKPIPPMLYSRSIVLTRMALNF